MMAMWNSSSAEETQAIAEALGRAARPGDVLLLVGPLGAGKTCFAQGLARGLEVKTPVKSPTFVLVTQHKGRIPFTHVDLYRIEGARSLDDLGLEERGEAAVLAVEWGEKIESRVTDGLIVVLKDLGPGIRRIGATARGQRAMDWLAEWVGATKGAWR
jgi:tRNA threonylcarbamoyladenosine biosynthesis protein TsaE